MKRNYKLPLLILPLLLSACNPTSAPTEAPTTENPTSVPTEAPTSAPTETPTETPTEAPTSAPTETPTEAPTSAPTETPTETPTEAPTTSVDTEYVYAVNAEVGTSELLKTFISNLADEQLISVHFSKSIESSTTNADTQIEVMYRSDEIYAVTTEVERSTSGDETKKEQVYRGIVDGLYYDTVISSVETFSRVSRSKILEESEEYQKDIVSPDQATEGLASLYDSYKLNCLSEYGYWNDVLDNEDFKETSYEITTDEYGARIIMKGYTQAWTCSLYTLILNFDRDVKLISGTLNTDKYSSENWSTIKHQPKDPTLTTSKTKVSLDGVEYGEPLPTRDTTMVDLSKYYVESLTPDVEITNFVVDPKNGMAIFSEPNTIYPNRPIDCPNDYIRENKAYLPATALDSGNLYITGASVDGFITLDAYGWNVSGKVGDVAEIYIGNAFNDKIGAIEVEIVKAPIKNDPMFSPNAYVVEGEGYEFEDVEPLPQLTLTGDGPYVLAISTSNNGPFDSLPLGFLCITEGIVEAKLIEDQQTYLDTYGKNAVYFTVTPVSEGYTVFAMVDPATSEGYYELGITVE